MVDRLEPSGKNVQGGSLSVEQEATAPVALVTGGARKLGASISRHLALKGFRVVINYRTSRVQAQDLAARMRKKGGEGLPVRADVTRPGDVRRMLKTVRDVYGRLDVLVNNVGDYLEKPLSKVTFLEWDSIIKSNLYSVFTCTREALPLMREGGGGRILVIGYAPAGKIAASPRCAVYHLAKTGALCLTKAVAVEEASHGITVNMISPGTLFNSVKKPSKDPGDYIPAGRFCRYSDVLGALDYLLSSEAAYVTGGHFVVSGGYAV